MSLKLRLVVLITLAISSAAVPMALAQVSSDDGVAPSVSAKDCPESNAVFEQNGLPIPDDYAPICPDPSSLEAEIDKVTVPGPPAELREAIEKGVIRESQDPKDYPPEVQRAIGLTQSGED